MREMIVFLALLGACHGGLHRKGDRMFTVHGDYAEPILGYFLWWNGRGDVPSAAAGVANRWFFEDRWAFSVGLTPTWYRASDYRTWGLEFETGFRWYFTEWEKVGIFWDFNGGFLYTEDPIPQTGTDYNLTFALGPGVEWQLGGGWSVLGGAQLHHISNGKGLNIPSNPAQNETRVWLGFGRAW